MLFGRGEDEDGVCRWFFECLEEGVERRLRQHVHLVDDIDAVPSYLRGDTYLFGQRADVVHRIVRGGIQLMDVETASLVESAARFAFAAGLAPCGLRQLMVLAKMRAQVVLPTPRGPQNR